jgi:4-hydroxy-tetrahydrodipicolinate reductase
LKGHAYHTYRLTSPDGLVSFEFQVRNTAVHLHSAEAHLHRNACALWLQHNVCGRSIYAQGTVDAVLFIAQQAKQRAAKTAYNMVDVISAEFVQ